MRVIIIQGKKSCKRLAGFDENVQQFRSFRVLPQFFEIYGAWHVRRCHRQCTGLWVRATRAPGGAPAGHAEVASQT
ncbi:MAG TPA: hypothetical protein DD666_19200 [Advenella kashmirensis]|uniref:Uncharacterized protein n=1 Tax=Advenella kashmirensis TaxID=310575 RepID=A0A356LKG6_9BURK|nr:hypothetical protein [Advenella kashmirensis]